MYEPLKTMCPQLTFLNAKKDDGMNWMDYLPEVLPAGLYELKTSAEGMKDYSGYSYGKESDENPAKRQKAEHKLDLPTSLKKYP
ncbi:hypothetical protein Cantr_03920 [Candida viswanathii]|uniref:Uncharacterized protein n=1 Tax=Candida viswanathii TaxID=5486 RepID=A0A367XPE4_9ASCO|nr:hypothetical protein Cantr_03920 [Candida viswanathii]